MHVPELKEHIRFLTQHQMSNELEKNIDYAYFFEKSNHGVRCSRNYTLFESMKTYNTSNCDRPGPPSVLRRCAANIQSSVAFCCDLPSLAAPRDMNPHRPCPLNPWYSSLNDRPKSVSDPPTSQVGGNSKKSEKAFEERKGKCSKKNGLFRPPIRLVIRWVTQRGWE